jgi:hypothetical protein
VPAAAPPVGHLSKKTEAESSNARPSVISLGLTRAIPHDNPDGRTNQPEDLQCRRSAVLLKRQFADVDHARRCHDRNFEMICLYDVVNVARAVRDNVDSGPVPQAVIEQSSTT